MKYFFTLMFATMLSFSAIESAEAKRFGSGGFGKAFKTSPFKKASPATPAKPSATPDKAKSARPGMMGGLMGGLLAGGLFAYLLGSGAFEGVQFMDILLFALAGFVLFKLFARPKAKTQYAGMQRGAFEEPNLASQNTATAFNQAASTQEESIPLQFPQGFDVTGFEQGALDHFKLVHKAWDDGNLTTIEEYVHPELLAQLQAQRQQYGTQLDNQVVDLSASIVRSEPTANDGHRISILFRGLMKDMQSNEEHGVFDVWHLEKAGSSPWLIIGIEAE
ncbi:Tim44 domain-containing protein [Oceaniserpentilla sp. 4NH20-0058]|uniref:Tim44 domain-containing protein n=1 Tax=Oceaniserpentilla sp. 4NH20-0058 TaxID=3127660 RepID=UPI003109330C